MPDPNSYIRTDDLVALLQAVDKALNEKLVTAVKGLHAAEEGSSAYSAHGYAIDEASACLGMTLDLAIKAQGIPRFTYRSFTEYDGVTRYNALVSVDADRVPLEPVAVAADGPATIGYTLTVTRKADGEVRTRTGEMPATADGLRALWWDHAEGSTGSDCNHEVLFDPSRLDDDAPVDEPAVSAYVMELKLDDGTVVDLTSLDANDDLAKRLAA